jgi:hypothetical protein
MSGRAKPKALSESYRPSFFAIALRGLNTFKSLNIFTRFKLLVSVPI